MRFINVQNCKLKAKDNGKQISEGALLALDVLICETIDKACRVHNGGAKRIDETVINYVRGTK